MLHRDLFVLLRAFSSLVPSKNLKFPAHLAPSTIHDFLLHHLLLNPHFQEYPPSKQYQKLFWKWAIHHLELLLPDHDFEEVDERIYDHYLSLMHPIGTALDHSRFSPPSESYITHYWEPPSGLNGIEKDLSDEAINLARFKTATLLESRTTIESGTTGLRTWLAGFFLSQYLILHPELIQSKRILELGSGVGFLGIIVASLQKISGFGTSPPALWMSDIDEAVLARCRDNIQIPHNLSSSHPNINYRLLDWSMSLDPGQAPSLSEFLHDEINVDLILGADIVYDPSLIPALIGILVLSLQPVCGRAPKTALIAFTVRNEDTLGSFLDAAREKSLNIEVLPTQLDGTMFFESVEGSAAHDTVKIVEITLLEHENDS